MKVHIFLVSTSEAKYELRKIAYLILRSKIIVLPIHIYARVAQLVEYDLAKVGVAGSSPVSRSVRSLSFKTSFVFKKY